MRLFAQRALERKEPLADLDFSIGTHPIEITGSGYRAPLGRRRYAIAGGIRAARRSSWRPGETIDLPYIADAEIVLRPRFCQPAGHSGGRFGEFTA